MKFKSDKIYEFIEDYLEYYNQKENVDMIFSNTGARFKKNET